MIKLKPKEYDFTFAKSSGSGGQNVNKLNTQAILTWDMKNSTAVKEEVKERFRANYKRFVTEEDKVVVQSERHRSQKRNKDDCVQKLHAMLNSVRLPPKKRKPTRPSRSSIRKNAQKNKRHSEKKRLRKKVF